MEKGPINRAENLLWRKLTDEGWKVLRRGWPDFFCYRDNEVMLIEVKSEYSHRLKSEQLQILLKLAQKGIASYRWSPDLGLEEVTGKMADIESDKASVIRALKNNRRQEWLRKQSPEIQMDIAKIEAEGGSWDFIE